VPTLLSLGYIVAGYIAACVWKCFLYC